MPWAQAGATWGREHLCHGHRLALFVAVICIVSRPRMGSADRSRSVKPSLGKIGSAPALISPLVLAVLFYGCVTPIGFLMRLAGNDPMRRKLEPAAKSYWITREPPGPSAETFKNQF
jgi:hypothetical protein